jgi:flagellar hook-length control protein FliK
MSVSIKTEKQDILMSLNDIYPSSSFANLPSRSDVLQQHFHDQTSSSSRVRSASSSILPTPPTSFAQYTIKNPLSVQPPAKQTRMTQFSSMTNSQIFPNTSTPHQHYDRKSYSSENNRQVLEYFADNKNSSFDLDEWSAIVIFI